MVRPVSLLLGVVELLDTPGQDSVELAVEWVGGHEALLLGFQLILVVLGRGE